LSSTHEVKHVTSEELRLYFFLKPFVSQNCETINSVRVGRKFETKGTGQICSCTCQRRHIEEAELQLHSCDMSKTIQGTWSWQSSWSLPWRSNVIKKGGHYRRSISSTTCRVAQHHFTWDVPVV